MEEWVGRETASFRLPPSPQGPYADRFVVLTARIDGDDEPALTTRVYFCESLEPDGGSNDRCRARPPPTSSPC